MYRVLGLYQWGGEATCKFFTDEIKAITFCNRLKKWCKKLDVKFQVFR
jgi:hypothetical protein